MDKVLNHLKWKSFGAFVVGVIFIFSNLTNVMAATTPNWESLYKSKIQQIENEYKRNSKKNTVYDTLFFSLQDIDFDGVPELYHTLIRTDKGDYELLDGSEEIYYIKNNRVVNGKIEKHDTLGLLPAYTISNTMDDKRWQFALYNKNTDQVNFVTKDTEISPADKGAITITELTFNAETGLLTANEILSGKYDMDAEKRNLSKYEFVGVGSYYSMSRLKNTDIWDWEAPYIIPSDEEIIENETTIPEWNTAYQKFIEDKKYSDTKQKYYTQYGENILFGLRDLDDDDIPEIIVKNGAKAEDEMVNYAYTYKNKSVSFLGNIGTRKSEFSYTPGSGYNGLFWESSNTGYYPCYYYSISDGKIKEELVSEEKVEYINSKINTIKTQATDDDKLYTAYKNADAKLPMYSTNDILDMGWENFIALSMEADNTLFSDISRNSWCYEAAKYNKDNGLMSGVSVSSFDPNGNLTRAMFVTILYRMEKEPDTKTVKFKDVPSNSWYANAVSWASQKGIVNGVEKDLFAPDDNITREQLASILYRYAEYKKYSTKTETTSTKHFIDNKDISSYATTAMDWAIEKRLISGTDESHLTPHGNATRGQTAVVLYRFCETIKK